LKMPVQKRKAEAGGAVLVFILVMSFFLIGALGWGLDGAQMYAQRQMAQAAADAAAQAGIFSFFLGTNTAATYSAPSGPYGTPQTYTCTSTDTKTPCKYSAMNAFSPASGDTVALKFGDNTTAGAPAVSLDAYSTSPVSWMTVTVTRTVPTILMRIFGVNSTTVVASGTAAILDVPSSVPIIVTHPSLPGSLSFNGNPTITIIGGPSQSVEVNSSDSGAVSTTSCSNATVDLHLAGPGGNGADFGTYALNGPSSPCFTFLPGTKPGQYLDKVAPIQDPLSGVPVPSSAGLPTRLDPPGTVGTGTYGCPSTPTCPFYQPGLYSSGITVKSSNTNGVSLFAPGLYYISGGGFNMASNSAAQMATGITTPDPNFPEIGTSGMVVFNTGTNKADIFNFDANAGASSPITLVGAPDSSRWQGVLFYEDPYATGGAHIGTGPSPGHTIQGGGTINLTGTIYMSTRTGVDSTHFQNLTLQGASGSTTNLIGEIIVNTLSMGGNPNINMTLSSTLRTVRQVALVQ